MISGSTLALRTATPLDVAAIDALLARSYGPLLRADYPPSVLVVALPRIARAQPRLLASGHYFVAEEGGRPLGVGGWSRADPHGGPAEPGLGHVRHVATDARVARRGVGRAVLEAVVEDAAFHGTRRLRCLSTLTAVPFYRALGFQEEGRRTLAFGALAFPVVEMSRAL
jgi:GNAT superfamily N-acetyltransferase